MGTNFFPDDKVITCIGGAQSSSKRSQGYGLKDACQYGLAAAAFALSTEHSVARDLSFEDITTFLVYHNAEVAEQIAVAYNNS